MSKKIPGILTLMFMFLVFPLSASMVSFLVVETGLNEGMPNSQQSALWESGLMEVFFSAGHIVTNYPIARMEKKPAMDLSGGIESDFNDAALGGSDYFVLGFLEYDANGRSAVPLGMTLKLYSTRHRELVFEERFSVGKGRNHNEEYQLAQDAGRVIISRIRDN